MTTATHLLFPLDFRLLITEVTQATHHARCVCVRQLKVNVQSIFGRKGRVRLKVQFGPDFLLRRFRMRYGARGRHIDLD